MFTNYVHTDTFHRSQDAEEIVPLLLQMFKPKSVLDVGCGLGHFLRAFSTSGVKDFFGIESPWIDKSNLVIPQRDILFVNLEQPLHLGRHFDIVLCLEVAEHLSVEASEDLIDSLTAHSDIIVFSAALPFQGGQNHINEQWIEFWESIFQKFEFILTDPVRPLIWDNKKIHWWYKQNLLVAVNNSNHKYSSQKVFNLVHPDHNLLKIQEIDTLKHYIGKIMRGEIEMDLAKEIMKNAENLNISD